MSEQINIIDNLPIFYVCTNLNGKIIDCNNALCEALGKSKHDVLSTNLDAHLTRASSIFMQTHLWPMLRQDSSVSELFIKLESSKNERLPVLVNAQLINTDDAEVCHWVFFVTHERNKFERELIEAKELVVESNRNLSKSQTLLAQSNEELMQFVHSVSHDLRAPLITIDGFASSLRSELSDILSEKQQFRFSRINENVKQMQALMDGLLALSRINQQDVVLRPVNLETIITRLLSLVERPLQQAGADVTVQLFPKQALGHETLIHQCLLNLLTNAINYRSSERALSITIKTSVEDDRVAIHVIDNGIGIAEQDQERIFSMFERLHVDKGTGVGLALVSVATKKLKATIEVQSELDKGSTFSIFLLTPEKYRCVELFK